MAAEYEKRLALLFVERLGAGEGDLMRAVDRATLYLPNDLAQRLRELVAGLEAVRSGSGEIEKLARFRASADAIIAAVAAVLPTRKPERSRSSPGLHIRWHLLIALTVPLVGLSLHYALKIDVPLLVGVLLFWAWGGYLYWVIERIVQVWLAPSVTRGGLRTLVASLFFWCPVALGWAVLRFMDWRRTKYGTEHATPHEASSMFDADRGQFAVNPTTGLPMMGSVDIGGNPHGFFGKQDN